MKVAEIYLRCLDTAQGTCAIPQSFTSSSRSPAPVESIDIDNKIASQISFLFKCVDNKLIFISKDLFSKISDG